MPIACLKAIVDTQELVKLRLSEPDGVDLRGRKVGILGFDSLFRKAQGAKSLYVLKSLLGFQAGVNPAVKQQLRSLFAANPNLKIFYGFPRGSEAAMTFLGFKKEVGFEWPMNVYWKEIEDNHPLTSLLGTVFACPFFIEHEDGRVEVLLEVPVKVVCGIDQYDLAGYASLLVELSDTHMYRLWSIWKSALEGIQWESTPLHIKRDQRISDAIIRVRDGAYDFPSSSRDQFDSDSIFVVAEIEGINVGSIRTSDSEKISPLRSWIKGKLTMPHGKGVVELTRGVVDPSKQTWVFTSG
jgi:hypothetical protein